MQKILVDTFIGCLIVKFTIKGKARDSVVTKAKFLSGNIIPKE